MIGVKEEGEGVGRGSSLLASIISQVQNNMQYNRFTCHAEQMVSVQTVVS